MPTVQEVLKESGFTDQEISAMDARAINAFTGVLNTAQQERQANVEFYDNRIVPALVNWDEEKVRLDNERARIAAEAAFYRTQAEQARASGFIASDAPTYTPPQPQQRDQSGRYVTGVPGSTPGSPTYFDVNRVYDAAGTAVGVISDIEWEHQKLFGKPMPISPTQLIAQADAVKLDPKTFASRQFGFDARRQELQKQEQEAHDSKIRTAAVAENDKKWAERLGSNPDVRMPMQNPRMTDVARASKAGKIPDPLMLNDNERRQATRAMIREDMAEAER